MTLFETRFVAVLLAPIVGSFLGVLIRRLPAGRPIALGRSDCDTCHHPLGPADLVPLLSYAARRGACRHCGAPIGRFHPAVEIATLAVTLLTALATSDVHHLWLGCLLAWTLLPLAWIDFEHRRLPDPLTLPLLLAGLAATAVLDQPALTDHAAAAALGYAAFRCIAWLYRRLRGREGLGQGDAKLLAAAGAWVGLAELPIVILVGGSLTLAVALLRGKAVTRTTALPFGPGLAAATWIVWLATGQATSW